MIHFYKVLSYACLCKADTGAVDEIPDTDITVSLIREHRPVKLLGQLGNKYHVRQEGKGIYRIYGMLFPMQVIVAKELDERQHALRSLTRNMDISQAKKLLDTFDGLVGEEVRAKAGVVINLVSDINSPIFEQIVSGGGRMSEALKRLVLPELGELKELLADKDAKLADKDAEIAALKRMLAEVGKESR